MAEQLALTGSQVTLCTNAALAGETLQLYTRNHYVGRLHKLVVNIITHARLFGVDDDTVYLQNTLTQEAMPIEGISTVILALGHQSVDLSLPSEDDDVSIKIIHIGDCVSPRTAEEAIYEGFLAGREI